MNIINILLWIVFGGLAGWLASILVGADAAFGTIGNVLVGIAGAFIGGWMADKTGIKSGEQGADRPTDIWAFIWAVIGAIILIVLLNLLF